jgi:ribulose bisphosphate carboxylase small subunit
MLIISQITESFNSKLSWNVPSKVLYQIYAICVDWRSKMTATAWQFWKTIKLNNFSLKLETLKNLKIAYTIGI